MKNFYKNTKIILGQDFSKVFYIILLFPIVSLLDVTSLYIIIKYLSAFASNNEYINFYTYILHLPEDLTARSDLMIKIGIAILIFYTLKSIVSFCIQILIIKFTFSSSASIIKRLFDYYLFNLIQNTDSKNISKAIQNITNHTFVYVHQGLFSFLKILSEIFLFFAILLLLLYENIILTLILLLFFSVLIFIYLLFTRIKIKRGSEIISDAQKKVINIAKESLQGLDEVYVYNLQKKIIFKLKLYLNNYKYYISRHQILQDMPKHILEYTLILLLLTYILYSFSQLGSSGDLLENIILFGLAALRLAPSLSQIIVHINNIRFAQFASDCLKSEIIMTNNFQSSDAFDIDGYKNKNNFKGLKINNAFFKYPGSPKETLKDINLNIFKGDMIGIVGESGAGKTTLIKIILGILNFDKGSVHLNDKISNLSSLKNNIAYVGQKSILFDGSISDNITLFEDGYDQEKLNKAMQLAKIDWLSISPDGYEISSDNPNLSGGQIQRIAIARAFYSEREIMILDEITSSLDAQNVRVIQDSLLKMKSNKTIIIITHNKILLRDCDSKFIIEKSELKKIS